MKMPRILSLAVLTAFIVLSAVPAHARPAGDEAVDEEADIDIDAWGLEAVSIDLPRSNRPPILTAYLVPYTVTGSQTLRIQPDPSSNECVDGVSIPDTVDVDENPQRRDEVVLDAFMSDNCNRRAAFATWTVRWPGHSVQVRVSGSDDGPDVATCARNPEGLCSRSSVGNDTVNLEVR